jgi:serine/threonine protein phosphatase PrpC
MEIMNAKTLTQILLAIVLAGSAAAYAVERPILVAIEGGKSVALFNIGDSRCVLVDDQIRCTRVPGK